MNDNRFLPVRAFPEFIGAYVVFHPHGVIGIFANHQHKGLYDRFSVISGINLQLCLCSFMAGNAIRQHHLIQLLVAEIIKIYIGTSHSKGCAGITIFNCF